MDTLNRKRQANQIMLDSLRHSQKPIAFFCECDRGGCYQAAWLTSDDYDRNRNRPGWRALADIHREDGHVGRSGVAALA